MVQFELALHELRDPEKTVMSLVSGFCAQKTFTLLSMYSLLCKIPK
jgi:hypothetical protein